MAQVHLIKQLWLVAACKYCTDEKQPSNTPGFKVSGVQQSFYILLVMPIIRQVRGMIRSQAYKARNLDRKVVRTLMGAQSESFESSPLYNYGLFTGPGPDIIQKLHNIFLVSKYIDCHLLLCFHVIKHVSVFIF